MNSLVVIILTVLLQDIFKLIDRDLRRNHINKSISRITMLFKRASAEEILPDSIYHALLIVSGQKKGRGIRQSDSVDASRQVAGLPQD